MNIGIIGGNGFLGKEIANGLRKDNEIDIITKDCYVENSIEYDVLINANGNSKKYLANNNPLYDFDKSVVSVFDSIQYFNFKKYIYISSADVYGHPVDPIHSDENGKLSEHYMDSYGFHKYLSELIVKKYCADYLILRCSALIGKNMKKGVIKDIIDCDVLRINTNSKMQFITNTEVSKIIQKLLEITVCCKIYNVGGIGKICIKDYWSLCGENSPIQDYEMNVNRLKNIYPNLKPSEYYVKELLNERVEKSL